MTAAVAVLALLLPALWLRLLAGMWRAHPTRFAGAAVPLRSGTGLVYLGGALAGPSLDPEEARHRSGQEYDSACLRAHFAEYTRWFPLHDRRHAGYDLVPAWLNPLLIALPALALVTLAHAVRLAVSHRRPTERPSRRAA
ncbi:hypothetical protein [Streptomyces sp. CA-253872]|uniref:hypothetical protein n=1 Tax=Streptomyces sp. CA-253872 TaxID=3240067 RepID=UPI003D8E56D9